MRVLLLLTLCILGASGCGYKAPLYIPSKAQAEKSRATGMPGAAPERPVPAQSTPPVR